MRFTAEFPPPPTPITLIRADVSTSGIISAMLNSLPQGLADFYAVEYKPDYKCTPQ